MRVCISLKEIYETLGGNLSQGGKIIKRDDDPERVYYDLVKDDGTFLLCDGEPMKVVTKTENLVYLETEHGNESLILSKYEFEIGTFN